MSEPNETERVHEEICSMRSICEQLKKYDAATRRRMLDFVVSWNHTLTFDEATRPQPNESEAQDAN